MTGEEKRIRYQFERLEQKKRELISLITPLASDIYSKQPSPERWSVAQAANHIYLSEKLSLAYLVKKLSYPDTIPPFQPKSWGGILLIKIVFFTHFRWKAPKAINMWEQQSILSPAELDEKWSSMRQELITLIETHQAALGKHLVYRHPYAGRMTMHQMLIFLNDHMAHHIKQIRKIINDLAH